MSLTEKHCWAEVSIDAIKKNYNFIKESFNKPFYVVLKADAYGHGAKYLAQVYEQLGAYGIAVSCFAEALEIRKSGVRLPILIMGYTSPEIATQLSKNQITQCVHSLSYAKELQKNSLYPIDCHLKLDTGMGRIGFDLVGDRENAYEQMKSLLKLTNLRFTGLFTHFSAADMLGEREIEYTQRQIDIFNHAYEYLERYGFNFKVIHGQNSAGILRKCNGIFNVQRAGIILYGENPSKEVAGSDITPVMELKTIVTNVKNINCGQYVGYGLKFCADRKMKIATVAAGYADGIPRALNDKNYVMKINGGYYPLIAVCMDQCMLDVSFGNIKVGDEVVAMGGEGKTSFDAIAEKTSRVNYEISCGIQRRVPRVYIENGKVIHVENNM